MKQLDPSEIASNARAACKSVRAATPRTGQGERPRGAFVEMEFKEAGKRITYTGQKTRAIPLFGMSALTDAQRNTGVIYGAMVNEMAAGGIRCVSIEAMPSGGGGAGPEGAIDRRMSMRDHVSIAKQGMAVLYPMRPMRPARRAIGNAALGKTFLAKAPRGKLIDLRQPISARAIVEMICVGEMELAAVLRSFGWPVGGRSNIKATELLAKSLSAILYLWGDETRGAGGKTQSWRADDQRTG